MPHLTYPLPDTITITRTQRLSAKYGYSHDEAMRVRRMRLNELESALLYRFNQRRHSWAWHERVIDAIEAEIFDIDVKRTPCPASTR